MHRQFLTLLIVTLLFSSSPLFADITWTTPQLFTPANVSNAQDWRVVFTADNLNFYLESERNGNFANTQILRATRSTTASPWSVPAPVNELNSGDQDHFYWVSANQTEAYMARHGNPVPSTFSDIYRTTRATPADPWGTPAVVSELSTPDTFEWHLTLTGNGLTGIFSSTRAGGVGGMDLWQTSRASTSSPWTAPVLVTSLNSTADDRSPYLTSDGLQVYFARAGQGLFWATRSSLDSPFITPIALPFGADALDPTLSPDDNTLYYTKPNGSIFNYDIYSSTRIPEPASIALLLIGCGAVLARRK